MATYESVTAEYEAFGATDDDCTAAAENALQSLQDEHGYENVTGASMEEGGKYYAQFIELYASSLEGVRSENGFNRRGR